jgi:hypothetical protein
MPPDWVLFTYRTFDFVQNGGHAACGDSSAIAGQLIFGALPLAFHQLHDLLKQVQLRNLHQAWIQLDLHLSLMQAATA